MIFSLYHDLFLLLDEFLFLFYLFISSDSFSFLLLLFFFSVLIVKRRMSFSHFIPSLLSLLFTIKYKKMCVCSLHSHTHIAYASPSFHIGFLPSSSNLQIDLKMRKRGKSYFDLFLIRFP
nr:MAG TPA: hypothetical protein [Caudoviricetes sp.]